jgi:hypothetical protein
MSFVVREDRCADLGKAGDVDVAPEQDEQGAQKLLEPAREQREVVACGGKHRISAAAISALEIIAAHPMVTLHVADHGLDSSSSPRRITLVTRRIWPLIQTLNLSR